MSKSENEKVNFKLDPVFLKSKLIENLNEALTQEIINSDVRFGLYRDYKHVPDQMHIDEYRNYTLMIPSEKNAKSMVERHAKDGTVTWMHVLIEEVCEAAQAVTPEDRINELLQVAAVAINAACHLNKEFVQNHLKK